MSCAAQDCYYFRPPTLPDLAHLDLPAAFRYFSRSFRQPAEFTVCFTGSLKVRHRSSPDVKRHTCLAAVLAFLRQQHGHQLPASGWPEEETRATLCLTLLLGCSTSCNPAGVEFFGHAGRGNAAQGLAP